MAKLADPILFSTQFGVDPLKLFKLGAFDPTLNIDSNLFIDPLLFRQSSHPEINKFAVSLFDKHFRDTLLLIQTSKSEGDKAWLAALEHLTFPEISNTYLGYGDKNTEDRDTGFLVEESVFYIKTGYFHKYTIREYKSKNILIAKGTLSFERNYWLIELNGIIHKEKVAIRLFAPIATTESMTWGFFQSMDYLGNPIVGPIIFSRTVLSSEDVKSEFTRKVKAVSDYNILTAKK